MNAVEDHNASLLVLRARRLELVMSVRNGLTPLSENTINKLADLQLAITAMEAVIDELAAVNRLAN